MTWRRIAPWVIGVVAILAIFINLPRQTLGLTWLPSEIGGIQFRTVLGLDLEGGLRVTLEATGQGDTEVTADQIETARNIIERRVAGIGVSEPQVRTETAGDGSRRIVVEVPGVSDQQQIRERSLLHDTELSWIGTAFARQRQQLSVGAGRHDQRVGGGVPADQRGQNGPLLLRQRGVEQNGRPPRRLELVFLRQRISRAYAFHDLFRLGSLD